jgi:hypothetical protein
MQMRNAKMYPDITINEYDDYCYTVHFLLQLQEDHDFFKKRDMTLTCVSENTVNEI